MRCFFMEYDRYLDPNPEPNVGPPPVCECGAIAEIVPMRAVAAASGWTEEQIEATPNFPVWMTECNCGADKDEYVIRFVRADTPDWVM